MFLTVAAAAVAVASVIPLGFGLRAYYAHRKHYDWATAGYETYASTGQMERADYCLRELRVSGKHMDKCFVWNLAWVVVMVLSAGIAFL